MAELAKGLKRNGRMIVRFCPALVNVLRGNKTLTVPVTVKLQPVYLQHGCNSLR
jgi:hypothetical protein